ncbi:MAG: hypothetical protein WC365_09115 [Candidatus Babeliales bacterium]|jgi:hypothetical protein
MCRPFSFVATEDLKIHACPNNKHDEMLEKLGIRETTDPPTHSAKIEIIPIIPNNYTHDKKDWQFNWDGNIPQWATDNANSIIKSAWKTWKKIVAKQVILKGTITAKDKEFYILCDNSSGKFYGNSSGKFYGNNHGLLKSTTATIIKNGVIYVMLSAEVKKVLKVTP